MHSNNCLFFSSSLPEMRSSSLAVMYTAVIQAINRDNVTDRCIFLIIIRSIIKHYNTDCIRDTIGIESNSIRHIQATRAAQSFNHLSLLTYPITEIKHIKQINSIRDNTIIHIIDAYVICDVISNKTLINKLYISQSHIVYSFRSDTLLSCSHGR